MSRNTRRQQEIYNFIVAYMKANHAPPTYREIAEHFGYRSPNGVSVHLQALERDGFIEVGGSARSIRLLGRVGCPTCGGLGTVPEEVVATPEGGQS